MCVEVATNLPDVIAVRDSKNPAAPPSSSPAATGPPSSTACEQKPDPPDPTRRSLPTRPTRPDPVGPDLGGWPRVPRSNGCREGLHTRPARWPQAEGGFVSRVSRRVRMSSAAGTPSSV
ncbi:hypothetical protein [Sphaerisporangium flaviroseum]|uniref:hypothetical protein n=1 Tax=Sphaerisporangium flaviroseum TaxID=509199 RepID=UPI0031ED633A